MRAARSRWGIADFCRGTFRAQMRQTTRVTPAFWFNHFWFIHLRPRIPGGRVRAADRMARRRDLAARCARGLTESSRPKEGAGKTGCALHPRSRVQCAQRSAHTSIQVQRRASGLPCAMALRLMPCSPRRRIPLASVIGELAVLRDPVGLRENLRRFDTSHGCQDHTVLPYAAFLHQTIRPAICDRPKFWQRRSSAVRLHAVDRSRKTALRTCLRAQRCRVHRTPSQRFVTIAIRPSFKGMRCGSYGGDLGETRRGIFLGEGTGRVKSD
jgi:hypothetical protein